MASTAQNRNVSVVIFPEGTRSRDGSLKEFKRGGTAMMLKAADQLPVVPTAVAGSWRLAENNLLPVPFGARVKIRFCDPIARSEDDIDPMADEVEAIIRSTVDELSRTL